MLLLLNFFAAGQAEKANAKDYQVFYALIHLWNSVFR